MLLSPEGYMSVPHNMRYHSPIITPSPLRKAFSVGNSPMLLSPEGYMSVPHNMQYNLPIITPSPPRIISLRDVYFPPETPGRRSMSICASAGQETPPSPFSPPVIVPLSCVHIAPAPISLAWSTCATAATAEQTAFLSKHQFIPHSHSSWSVCLTPVQPRQQQQLLPYSNSSWSFCQTQQPPYSHSSWSVCPTPVQSPPMLLEHLQLSPPMSLELRMEHLQLSSPHEIQHNLGVVMIPTPTPYQIISEYDNTSPLLAKRLSY